MFCKRCKKRILRKSPRQKYCKKCAYEIDKYKKMMRMRRKRSLGESTLWSHPYSDFEKEIQAIRREKKRIGI